MKLIPPFPVITQKFGENAVNYYKLSGLKGHPGIDYGEPWGTPMLCSVDSFCYLVVKRNDPAFYQVVYTIYDDGTDIYEVTYGHLSSMAAIQGRYIKQGDPIGDVGNTGTVYQGGVEVTEEAKLNGSHAGSHLHFQVRKLAKELASTTLDPAKHYVNNGTSILTNGDFHYYVPEWNNGYNGCVDPEQFFTDTQVIKDEITVLNTQTDPVVRQSFITLIIEQIKRLLGIT